MELIAILERLSQFDYDVEDEDLLQFIADSEEKDILSKCNQTIIPVDFMYEAIDMVCGQYLMIKKSSGKDIGIDIDSAVSSISEGDVSISTTIGKGTKTPEQRFEEFIAYLRRGEQNVYCYRRLKW